MGWLGRLWELFYLGPTPWGIGGPRPELVHLVERGKLEPCRAIDLGYCNFIYGYHLSRALLLESGSC